MLRFAIPFIQGVTRDMAVSPYNFQAQIRQNSSFAEMQNLKVSENILRKLLK